MSAATTYDDLRMRGFSRVPLEQSLAERIKTLSSSFYSQPLQTRLQVGVWNFLGFLGYMPSEFEAARIRASAGSIPIFADRRARGYSSYDFVGHEAAFEPSGIAVKNQWLNEEFRSAALDLYEELACIMRNQSETLQRRIASDTADPRHWAFDSRSCSLMRILEYQATGTESVSKAHTDYEFLSLVWSDGPGLEVLGNDLEWRDAWIGPHEGVLLAGDMVQIASGGAIRSAPHRVRFGQTLRRSVVYFQGLQYGETISEAAIKAGTSFGSHLCGMLVRGTPHLAAALADGRLRVDFDIPVRNPFRKLSER